jgi:carbon dioxide concentrating mechanism protein CcmN
MHLPRSPLISDAHLYVSGNVTIDPSAAIAPSVMLQADPGCQLIIAAGVSIGSGCVLHAHQGILEIDTGATLGSGVLIIGKGKIGANACIGSMATLIDSSIAPDYAVPPGSIIGDRSRQANAPIHPPEAPAPTAQSASAPAAKNGKTTPVHGQVYLERMMVMMFPHRQNLENPSPDD